MDKTKASEITVRVVAIIISFILWMYVNAVENPERQVEISGIPVKLVNIESLAQSGLVLMGNADDYTVKLTVKGRSQDVLKLKTQDFKLEANLGNGYRVKGINSILVELKDKPSDIEIPNQPVYISVELDELVVRNFPVNIKVEGTAKEGYANLQPTVKPEEVILKGAAKYMGSVNSVVANVDVKEAVADVQTSMPLQVLDKDGRSVPGIESTPRTVDIVVPVKKAKQVPITVKTVGSLPGGVFMLGTSAAPDKVSITGDDEVVNNIDSIETMPVSLEDIRSNTTKAVGLNLPAGAVLINKIDTVNVNIAVETTVTKDFNVQVNYNNLPGGLTADILTNTISVTVSGRESTINRVASGDMSATINLEDAPEEDGEYEYTPDITLPAGVDVVGINPPRVKVKITTKQG